MIFFLLKSIIIDEEVNVVFCLSIKGFTFVNRMKLFQIQF